MHSFVLCEYSAGVNNLPEKFMPKLTDFITKLEAYVVNSKKKDEKKIFTFFPRDRVFSKKQCSIVEAMLGKIAEDNGSAENTVKFVNQAFNELKNVFLEMLFEGKHIDKKSTVLSIPAITFKPVKGQTRRTCSQAVEKGAGTKCLQLVNAFRKALQSPNEVEFNYRKLHQPVVKLK